MDKPIITNSLFNPLLVQEYERYLPTAFDEGLSLLEKVNKIIVTLNQIGTLSNDVLEQWNQVMEWVMADGLDNSVNNVLQVMEADGTLAKIINIDLLNEKADKTYVDSQISTLTTTVNTQISDNESNVSAQLATFTTTINAQITSNESKMTDLTNSVNSQVSAIAVSNYINVLHPPAPLVAAKADGITDDSGAIQACIDYGVLNNRPVYVPAGRYKLKFVLQVNAFNFIGEGLATTFDCDACGAINVVNNGGRKVVEIGHFSIITTKDNCANLSAISLQPYTDGQRTIGVKFSHIEIGGGGTFGAGFNITDSFRTSIEHVGMTNCLNGVVIEGQAVQTSLFDVTTNQENHNTATTFNNGMKNGLTVRTDSHSGSSQSPESVKVVNCNFAGHDWGIYQQACTFASYENVDLDYCYIGGFYVSSALGGCTFRNAWIACCGAAVANYGIYVDIPDFDRNPLLIDGVHISWINTANINSIGVDVEAFRKNVTIKNVSVMGGANIQYGFRLKSPVEMLFEKNTVADGVATNTEFYIDGAQKSIFNYNAGSRMNVSGDGTWMEVRSNMIGTVTTGGTNTLVS
jgi:hypothetical protein